MSVSIVLVPLAVAAVAAWEVRGGGGRTRAEVTAGDRTTVMTCEVTTRMRDVNLLGAALTDLGARVALDEGVVTAAWQELTARFVQGTDGIWTAHLTGSVDEARAVETVRSVDAAYGRRVQQAVVRRLRERAPAAGMRLESESLDQDAVTLVFAVEGER